MQRFAASEDGFANIVLQDLPIEDVVHVIVTLPVTSAAQENSENEWSLAQVCGEACIGECIVTSQKPEKQ